MRLRPVFVAVACSLTVLASVVLTSDAQPPRPLRFGLIRSLFRAADEGTVLGATQIFGELVTMQSGVRGEFSIIKEPAELASRIDSGELEFGVLHGIEYAWIKDRFPEVKPLLLAYNQTDRLKALILVRADAAPQKLTDLKDKRLSFPRGSMNHVHLYLHQSVVDAGGKPEGFFGNVDSPISIDTALEAVIDGDADVTIVDGQALAHYREQKPVRSRRLRVLAESPVFPTATILYKGDLAAKPAALRLQTGLASAHERPLTRELLLLWRLSRFSKPPAEYEELVAGIAKSYPKPFEPMRFVYEPDSVSAGGGR